MLFAEDERRLWKGQEGLLWQKEILGHEASETSRVG